MTNAALGRVLAEAEPGQSNGTARTGLEEPANPERHGDLLKRWTTAELLAANRTFRWLVRGFAVSGTYGMTAGDEKTLKTYVCLLFAVAVASGKPLLGHFEVDTPKPVMLYVGEGGRIPVTLRLERLATAVGVDLADLPLYVSFDTAPVLSDVFGETLRRDLADLQPGLIILDPLYSFHGTVSSGGSVYEEGAILNALSAPCVDAGAVLNIANHNNKGPASGLKAITMAGGREWCDSWWLLAHREQPDVEGGHFQLKLTIGSRQWGGSEWDLDIDLGRFNVDLGCHNGDISWELARHVADDRAGRPDPLEPATRRILEVLDAQPWQLTKHGIYERVRGDRTRFHAAFNALADDGRIQHNRLGRTEGATTKTRLVWSHTGDPDRATTNPDGRDRPCSLPGTIGNADGLSPSMFPTGTVPA